MADRELYFPASIIDSERVAWYVPFLRRLEELPLDSTIQPLAIRLLCLPTWGGPCFIRLEAGGIRWHCCIGELDGDAGYEVGKLIRREHFEITSVQTERVHELWRYLRFWELPITSDTEDLLDGTEYVLEAVEGGRHGVVWRGGWEWGDTFGEFVDLLFEVAGLRPR